MPQKQDLVIDDLEYFEELKARKTFPLHMHWDGSVPVGSLFSFTERRGKMIFLPDNDINGERIRYDSFTQRLISTPEKLREFQYGLLTFYKMGDVFGIPISFMQTKEDLEEMAKALCRYLKTQNSPYAEVRFAPQYHLKKGLSLDQVIGYSLDGFREGEEQTGVKTKLIICIARDEAPEIGEAVVRAALQFAERGVVGIDLACYEPGNPPEKHLPAFQLTFDSPLKRTVHAGEMGAEEENLRNTYVALTELRADGISHSRHLYQRYYQDKDLIEMMIQRGVRLESNPLSNYQFFIQNLEELHLDELVDAGLMITVNPDDPAMWKNGDLVDSLYFLGKLYGDGFVKKVTANSIRASWGLSEEEKKGYLTEMILN
ncbi:MAG TPA: hypothetical protein VJA23_03355 [Candidatus Nanoarchaeia archaeon]|nr:hypothetical protein [Candidatus Nanoarchaeia archaeon]